MICARMLTSRALIGLVADDEVGLHGERPGDADALALPAAELVRIAVERIGVDAHRLKELAHLDLAAGAVGELMHKQGLADDVADGHAAVEAGVGVLEDHLHAAALTAQGAALEMRQVAALVEHAAGGGPDELQDGAPGGALAAAAFADQAERLAAPDLEVDAVDRVHGAHLVPKDDAAGDGEVDPEVLDRDQGLAAAGGGTHAGISAPAISFSRWKQADRRSPSVGEQLRHLLPALLGRQPAARREAAAGRQMGEVGRQPGDRLQAVFARLVEPRHDCAAGRRCTDGGGGRRGPWQGRSRRYARRT